MEYFYRYIITPTEFQDWKVWVMESSGLARDALHIYFGLFLFLGARFIFGNRPWSGPVAWLIAFTFAFLGEVLDYSGKGGLFAMLAAHDHLHDLINTLFWPTVLLAFGGVIFRQQRPEKPALTNHNAGQSLE